MKRGLKTESQVYFTRLAKVLLLLSFSDSLSQTPPTKDINFSVTLNYTMIIISFFISLVGSFTTLQLIHQLKFSVSKKSRIFWIFLSSCVLGGVAIWSMHFIGMSSVTVHYGTKPLKMSYEALITIFSFLASVVSCFIGLFVADIHHFSTSIKELLLSFRDEKYEEASDLLECQEHSKIYLWFQKLFVSHNDPDKPHLFQVLIGGTFTASGVSVMHYTGMEALFIDAKFRYSPFLFLLSILVALIASVAALVIVYSSKTILEHFIAAIVMAIAVSGMHYTGMTAVVYYQYLEVDPIAYLVLEPFQMILIVIVLSLFTCMLMVVIVSVQNSSRNEVLDRLVESKTKQLTEEINRSEELLLNILPPRIALKMKQGVTDIYEEYSNATILFSDIVGFTKLSNTMTSKQLVLMLNDLFSKFDSLVKHYQIEKIKTIGDAYMVVGGIPEDPLALDALKVMNFAIDMLKEIQLYNRSCKSENKIKIRIGMHTGRVVAGVIGTVKFAFDIWGEAVNIASRMESSGIENQIQLSETTAKLIQNKFELQLREGIEVKSLGKLSTYLYNPCS
eukprot:gene5262-8880_t